MVDGYWLPSHRADPRGLALYKRHYSYKKNARQRGRYSLDFVGNGENMVLLTEACDALFVWLLQKHRLDNQRGVSCSVFRNEGDYLSSEMIREADDLAWKHWPDELRHWTYVDPNEVASPNPGYCFIKAGWRRCGVSANGKLIFEIVRSL